MELTMWMTLVSVVNCVDDTSSGVICVDVTGE